MLIERCLKEVKFKRSLNGVGPDPRSMDLMTRAMSAVSFLVGGCW